MDSRRWPITLWLYVLKDMCRLIALTAGVLVTVIAFAATVKPLSDGQLSPVQCLKFMGLAMLPMLQYALPFAACFGATLAYYRLASDNEVTAAHAGGVSHRVMLVPVVFTGIVLAVVIWWLSNSTIPRFLKGMAEMVSQNATQFIESSVLQGQALKTDIGGKPAYVYADHVRRIPVNDSNAQYERLWLSGILFVTLTADGQVATQGTAREAIVWLRRGGATEIADSAEGGSATEVVLKPVDFIGVEETGKLAGGEVVRTFRVPNKFRDDPKFMTAMELVQVSREPERLPQVDRRRRTLAMILAEDELGQQMRAQLRSSQVFEFVDGAKTRYIVRARDLRQTKSSGGWWRILPVKGQRVTVDRVAQDGRPQQGYVANYGELRVTRTRDPLTDEEVVSVNLRLREMSAMLPEDVDLGDDTPSAGSIGEWRVDDLMPLSSEAQALLADTSDNLVRAAEAKLATGKSPDPVLAIARQDLLNRTADLLREVFSKHNERLAMALACLVMVLTGAVMAMRLRDSLPLTIYLWAFFPALGAVLTISTGQQLTHQHGPVGLLVLWGGVIGLGTYTWYEFRRLARN